MKEIKLRIDGYDDRREIVSILADNGYKVKIKEEEIRCSLSSKYYVIIEMKGGKN